MCIPWVCNFDLFIISFQWKSIIKTLKCFMSEVCHLFFDDGKIMWSCVCLKCHCIYTLCKAKTCIKMHAMKFNNSNTFIPHQTIFFQSCQFAQSFIYSNTNTMLRFTHGIQNILREGLYGSLNVLSSSLMLYRHMRLGPLPRDIMCLVLKFCTAKTWPFEYWYKIKWHG